MPRRMWMILDALQEPTGPFSDRELVPVLERLGDCYVFTDGMADWERASEVFARELSGERDSGLATDRVRPALDENAQPRNTRLNARRRAGSRTSATSGRASTSQLAPGGSSPPCPSGSTCCPTAATSPDPV